MANIDYTEEQTFEIGDRIELHPGCDLWMQGARYGTVIGLRPTPMDAVLVSLDKAKGTFGGPKELFRKI